MARKINDNKRLFTLLPLILDYYRLCNSLKIYEFGTILIKTIIFGARIRVK